MKKIFKRNNLLIILPVLITFLLVIGISYSFYLSDVETINKTNTVLIAEDVEEYDQYDDRNDDSKNNLER